MARRRKPAGFRRQVLTVGDVAKRLRGFLEKLPPVCVKGEVSGARVSPAGHLYFTIFDEQARMECIAYKRAVQLVRDVIRDGDEVIVTGTVSFYPPSGRLQMIVEQAEPSGVGRGRAALRRLMEQLAAEGLFDEERKQPLPRFPAKVAVVTSPNGAAVQDIIVSIRERFRAVDILVVPVPVQGDDAPPEIARAITIVDKRDLADVIIVGRGGGAEEDLAAFNDEGVVRAVAACRTPIVSAVGHEIDVTLTDMAADARALTPTAAGRVVVPDAREVMGRLEGHARMMDAALERRIAGAYSGMAGAAGGLKRLSPRRRIDELSQRVDSAAGRLERALGHSLALARGGLARAAERLRGRSPRGALRERKNRMTFILRRLERGARSRLKWGKLTLEKQAAALDALSPLAVLGRGYSLTIGPAGSPLGSIHDVGRGDSIETSLKDGTISSTVEETHERKKDKR